MVGEDRSFVLGEPSSPRPAVASQSLDPAGVPEQPPWPQLHAMGTWIVLAGVSMAQGSGPKGISLHAHPHARLPRRAQPRGAAQVPHICSTRGWGEVSCRGAESKARHPQSSPAACCCSQAIAGEFLACWYRCALLSMHAACNYLSQKLVSKLVANTNCQMLHIQSNKT